jgi:energy-coupling factor transporter ATP-binding protein EcfA2
VDDYDPSPATIFEKNQSMNTLASLIDVHTEQTVFAELRLWATGRPRWQQDALRRLMLNGTLTNGDIDELAVICQDEKAPFAPITDAEIASEAASDEAIALLRIENPTGINALVAEQKLEFAKEGMTVIYGDNGSGKSGYVRVLKHACRTLDRGAKILRDIQDKSATPQTAMIAFARGAVEVEFGWTPDAVSEKDLSLISIFDSRSANLHVEKTNPVAYIPLPMKIMEALALACDLVRIKLEAQVSALEAQTPKALKTPSLSADTAAGAFVHNLSAKSNLSQLALLANLSDGEKQRLTTLEGDLAQDPKRAAARVADQKSRLANLVAPLRRLATLAGAAAFLEREQLKTERDAKADTAKLASEALFAASPLPEIGQAIWRHLWEAARKYADEVAYPDRSFPDGTAGDDLCVLCQQPLTGEAIQRQTTFENFVKGTTKTEHEDAMRAYDGNIEAAKAGQVAVGNLRQLVTLIATELGDEAAAKQVRAFGLRATWRLRAYIRGQIAPGIEPTFPDQELAKLSTALTQRIDQLSADGSSPVRLALVKEYRELKDREALISLVEDIKAEIERLKAITTIKKAIRDTAKKGVTDKNKDFSDKLVTDALRGRFAREIEKMKLARMPVELRKEKDQNAVSYFQVRLVEKPDQSVGDIFSEGEHRCVALAAFLAELVTSKRHSGIVFDDPMSSLDHIHRRAIAARLAEEAAHRQVIVFTHDLAFLFELRRETEALVAKGKGKKILYQTIRRREAAPGYVEGDLPNKAKSALGLANALRSELKGVKGQFEQWNDTTRSIFCKGMIEQLREAWDQGIADFVFPVLGRFENSIRGNSLCKLAVLDPEDVKTVTAARGRLSEELHASAETLNPATVGHAVLVDEIAKLEMWLHSIDARQKEAKTPVTSYA